MVKDATKCKMAMHTDDNTCTDNKHVYAKGGKKRIKKTLSFLGKIHDTTVFVIRHRIPCDAVCCVTRIKFVKL